MKLKETFIKKRSIKRKEKRDSLKIRLCICHKNVKGVQDVNIYIIKVIKIYINKKEKI